MIESTFLGIPHTGHDRTDGWVHKGKHWLEHTADETADTLDEGATEIVDTAVAAVHAALSMVGTGCAQIAAAQPDRAGGTSWHPTGRSEIPIIPYTVFTPGIGVELNIRDNIGKRCENGQTIRLTARLITWRCCGSWRTTNT